LERRCQHAEIEKKDLINNFLYVKGCLDNLQMAWGQNPVQCTVAQIQTTYSQVVGERNRLAERVEALDKDREQHKQQREAELERVMNENARLLEEKDRFEKEKARLAKLYHSMMGTMGYAPQAPAVVGVAGYEAAASLTMAHHGLRNELEHKIALISRREAENESLRARLRKLAMV